MQVYGAIINACAADKIIQRNLSIAATLLEQHYDRYTGVAALQGFVYYGSLCS